MIRWLLPFSILLTACTRAPEAALPSDAVDPQIASAIALELARMVLRDNARKLYGLK